MKRILFIATHRPNRAPNQRFRFEQYLDFLNANGYQCEISYFIDAQDDKILYAPGNYFKKGKILLKAIQKRLADLKRANEFDIIFIVREAMLTGSIYFEKAFKKSSAKLIFDFDDSIWLENISENNKLLSWLKRPAKTSDIIQLSHLIFAGNQYLADYASNYNDQVVIIPTTIDTDSYQAPPRSRNEKLIIGWSGSTTTIQHFKYAIPFLTILKQKFGDAFLIKVIGDENYVNNELGIKGIKWEPHTEVAELSSFDIGIMPLPDDEWSKGKCGLKGLQYMALGIPTIMSPVGVNASIIQDGVNGYLASDPSEWVNKISMLMGDHALRTRIGAAARNTVIEKYSIHSQKNRYLQYFNQLTNQ
ncbi:MAG: hypothetical protein RIQ89_1981 [Bacteroidota bacterium]